THELIERRRPKDAIEAAVVAADASRQHTIRRVSSAHEGQNVHQIVVPCARSACFSARNSPAKIGAKLPLFVRGFRTSATHRSARARLLSLGRVLSPAPC